LHADAFAALSVRAFENDSWAEIAPEVFNDYDSRMAVNHKTIHQTVVTLQASGGISINAASDPRRTDLTEELVERMRVHFPNQQDVTSHTSPSDEARLVEATGFFERRRSGELTERRLLGITKDAQVVVHLVLLWLPQTFPPSCTVSCMEWYVLRRYCRGLRCMSYALTDCVASLGEMGDNWSDWVRRADWCLRIYSPRLLKEIRGSPNVAARGRPLWISLMHASVEIRIQLLETWFSGRGGQHWIKMLLEAIR